MQQFNVGVKGIVKVTVAEADGTVVSEKTIDNIETNYAINAMAKWLSGTPNSGTNAVLPPSKIGAGNGTGTVAATDTVLWSPITGTQKVCDQITFTQGYYAQFNLTYQTTDPEGYYNELGLFDTANNLWAHVAVNQYKTTSQTLTVQWMVYTVTDSSDGAAVSNYARSAIAKWLSGTSNVAGQAGAVITADRFTFGVGTGQVSNIDTALFSVKTGTTKNCTTIVVVQSTSVQFAAVYVDGDFTGQVNEVGLFDSAGNLWVHGLVNANRQAGYVMPTICQISIKQG